MIVGVWLFVLWWLDILDMEKGEKGGETVAEEKLRALVCGWSSVEARFGG